MTIKVFDHSNHAMIQCESKFEKAYEVAVVM